ncbi:hypothetical protein SDC9_149968 [bioreactor metagenome]|uniref:PASTA domain-containing protein n=1 Tax=bioreactor metagenome TaxID=1076179 RepID=A0A645ENA7_9ZZZZ
MTGFLEEAAVEQLSAAQLTPKVEHVSGSAEGKGTVISQDPAGGQTVLVGSTVTITVNDGPPVSPIPAGIVGKLQDEAITLLKQAGFTNVEPLAAPSNLDTVGAKKGQVVAVSPTEGQSIPIDQKVTLYVASGRSELPGTIIGMQDTEARELLRQAGYTNVSSDYLAPGDPDEPVTFVRGQVVYSDPATGTAVDSSTRIALWLASGESVMPNLIGLSHEAAEEKLTALGFTNVTFGPADDDHDDWVVTAQSVPADTARGRSDPIAITLGGATPTSSKPTSSGTSPSR